jgi:hypothetical protein
LHFSKITVSGLLSTCRALFLHQVRHPPAAPVDHPSMVGN